MSINQPVITLGGRGSRILAGTSWLTVSLPDNDDIRLRGDILLNAIRSSLSRVTEHSARKVNCRRALGRHLYLETRRGELFLSFSGMYYEIDREQVDDLAEWLRLVTNRAMPSSVYAEPYGSGVRVVVTRSAKSEDTPETHGEALAFVATKPARARDYFLNLAGTTLEGTTDYYLGGGRNLTIAPAGDRFMLYVGNTSLIVTRTTLVRMAMAIDIATTGKEST